MAAPPKNPGFIRDKESASHKYAVAALEAIETARSCFATDEEIAASREKAETARKEKRLLSFPRLDLAQIEG